MTTIDPVAEWRAWREVHQEPATAAVAAQEPLQRAAEGGDTRQPVLVLPHARHGTVYIARICKYRCARCRPLRHGRVGRYSAGCRCDACLRAFEATLRFAFAELEQLIEVRTGARTADVAMALGVDRRQVLRLRERGALTVDQADELAIVAGFHPATVWPEWLSA